MSNAANDYALPPALDLKLDKSVFSRREIVFAIGLPLGKEFKKVGEKLRDLSTGYLALPKFDGIYADANGGKRKLTLIRRIDEESKWELLRSLNVDVPESPQEDLAFLESHPDAILTENCHPIEQTSGVVLPSKPSAFRLPIEYENFTLERALKALLPADMAPVIGFSLVGHVAHFNLKPAALPYRKLIGQVVLDKLPHIRTVVNKAAKIDNEFRTFAIDLMAGEEDYLTEVKENGITFRLDFSKVYWNSRLGTEHSKIVAEVKASAKAVEDPPVVVYDVFAGVGPFSVPLARSGDCQVLANDLNPESYKYLVENVRRNSSKKHPLTEDKIKCFNMDGRDFIREVVIPHYTKALQSDSTGFFMLMNLPGLAIKFLDVFRDVELPMPPTKPIHTRCYCFVHHNPEKSPEKSMKQAEAEDDSLNRVCEALAIDKSAVSKAEVKNSETSQSGLLLTKWKVRFVRNTAPFKDMYCLEFDLYLPCTEQPAKRPKTAR